MIDTDELDKKTLREKWDLLTEVATCPYPLQPLVGARLLDLTEPDDDPRSTRLLVELKPGFTLGHVAHLTEALASFFNMPRDSVWIEGSPASARRIEITLIKPAEETA